MTSNLFLFFFFKFAKRILRFNVNSTFNQYSSIIVYLINTILKAVDKETKKIEKFSIQNKSIQHKGWVEAYYTYVKKKYCKHNSYSVSKMSKD